MSRDTLVDPQAEQAVLGALLQAGAVPQAALALKPQDFGEARHQAVFAAALALHAGGRALDHLTLAEQLKAQGRLEVAGGPAYLMQLDGQVPVLANLPAYVATVRDRALRRAVVARARALADEAQNLAREPARVAHQAHEDLAQLALTGEGEVDERGGVDVLELGERWDAFYRGERSPYLACGIPALDEVFRGFLPNVNLIGARASMGKTAFAAELAWGWLHEGIPGGIFGLEDGTGWLVERHAARALNLKLEDVGACRLNEYQQDSYAEYAGKAWAVLNERLWVHRQSGLLAPDLLRKAERWIAQGARWLLIDHGGRIGHESQGAKERYDLAIKRTVEALDNLAHNRGVPILVNWHFNRDGAQAGKPTMEAFKESGYLEAFSGTMLGLWERPENEGMLLVTVVKNRKGKRDVTVALHRDAEHGLVKRQGGFVLDLRQEASEREQLRKALRPRRGSLFGGEGPS